jgi:hypothetical protein
MRWAFTRVLFPLSLTLMACIERPEGTRVAAQSANRASLGEVLLKSAPTPQHAVGARFENGIELLGYDVAPEPAPRGGQTTVSFYYAATEDVQEDWQIFLHIDDVGKNAPRIGRDHYPAQGRLRTNAWRKGDIIKDTFVVNPPEAAAGLELWTGFYQGEDRLTVSSAGRGVNDGLNRIRVGVIPLK